MTNLRPIVCAAFLGLLSAPSIASAQHGPVGKNTWITLRGEALSSYRLQGPIDVASGLTFEWGMLQNKFFGVGTRVGFTRNDLVAGPALLMLGGPQAHIPLGDVVMLMPSLTTGLKLSQAGLGFTVLGALAVVARFDTFFAGAEFEYPFFVQSGASSLVLLPLWSANLVVGMYL